MAMTTLQALREAHVRPAGEYGDPAHSKRACPCCASLRPRSKDVTRVRRAQRRRENHALRTARPEDY